MSEKQYFFRKWVKLGALIICLSALLYVFFSGLRHKPDLATDAQVNQVLPILILPDMLADFKEVPEQEFRNQAYVLHIFASWCTVCVAELENWQTIMAKSSIPIYGVAYHDDVKELQRIFKDKPAPFKRLLLDNAGLSGLEWGVAYTPETLVVDKEGILRKRIRGEIDWEKFEKEVLPIFSEEKR